MTVAELLARSRSAIGHGTVYKLGAGGMNPNAARPYNINHECDCSGFSSWDLGFSRQTSHPLYGRFNGGWVNTDAMKMDALHGTGFFTKIILPTPGCIVVYGAKDGRVGHVGIVATVENNKMVSVIHCSSGNYRKTGDAIQETAPTVFNRPDAIFAWYEGIDHPHMA